MIRVRFYRDQDTLGWKLVVAERIQDRWYYLRAIGNDQYERVWVPESEKVPVLLHIPGLMADDVAKELSRSLFEAGYWPSEDASKELGATRGHLKDMRKIVSKVLEVDLP